MTQDGGADPIAYDRVSREVAQIEQAWKAKSMDTQGALKKLAELGATPEGRTSDGRNKLDALNEKLQRAQAATEGARTAAKIANTVVNAKQSVLDAKKKATGFLGRVFDKDVRAAKADLKQSEQQAKALGRQEQFFEKQQAKQEKVITKEFQKEIKQVAKVAKDNLRTNIFLTNTEVFAGPKEAEKRLDTYTEWLVLYDKELNRIRRLIQSKDDKEMLAELAKYVRPAAVEEEEAEAEEKPDEVPPAAPAAAAPALLGGAYMSRLDRILRSLDFMSRTLNDPQNAKAISEKQAERLRARVQAMGILANQLDENVQTIDFESLFAAQLHLDDNAYEIPPEMYSQYPPEVIEKAKLIITIVAAAKNVATKFMLAPRSVAICTVVAFLLVLVNIGVAVLFAVVTVKKIVAGALIKNPINRQAQDFNISKIGSFKSPYSMVFLFFILSNGLALGLGILGVLRIFANEDKHHQRTPGLVSAILFATVGQAVVGFLSAFLITMVLMRKLRMSAGRISAFNRHVYDNLYKDVRFLKNLRSMPSNSFTLMSVVKNALGTVPATASSEDIARAMFTLNMFMHFQKLGYRNPYTLDALSKTFNVVGLLRRQFYSPADFLHRRSTFIKDNGDIMRENLWEMTSNNAKNVPKDFASRLDNAAVRASELTSEANNLANVFYPEDAMRIFFKLFIYMVAAQSLPVLLLMYIFRKKTLQQSFAVALGVMFKKPRPAAAPEE
jgi:hypothetical protein